MLCMTKAAWWLLQITGYTDRPHGVQFRYRLVQ